MRRPARTRSPRSLRLLFLQAIKNECFVFLLGGYFPQAKLYIIQNVIVAKTACFVDQIRVFGILLLKRGGNRNGSGDLPVKAGE